MATSSTTHTHGNATLATEHRQCRWLEAHFQDGFAVLSSDANTTTSASSSCSARADSDRRHRPCRTQIQAGVERLIGCPFGADSTSTRLYLFLGWRVVVLGPRREQPESGHLFFQSVVVNGRMSSLISTPHTQIAHSVKQYCVALYFIQRNIRRCWVS